MHARYLPSNSLTYVLVFLQRRIFFVQKKKPHDLGNKIPRIRCSILPEELVVNGVTRYTYECHSGMNVMI